MSHRDTVADLYRHQEWADAAIWRAVAASEAAMTDTAIQDRLGHLHLVQWLYMHGWQGISGDAQERTFANAASRMSWGRAYHDAVQAFIATLDPEQLDRTFPFPWAALVEQHLGRPPAPVTTVDTLLQVTLHSAYHRGQIATRLRELGGEPPTTDFILWSFLGKPAAEWPATDAVG